ncbi:Uncharacterised protein [Salmonella enterica subsp. enterica serovar Daytona]|uniref:Uncharacterized protein n=1 Tax=Salmonella enterica subsp. enterica serovar Daytona TaxID=1962639 RepID=A0A447JLT6_SALET|nr:Uncharacterised protein [Salmonella enterica subsp. enterica serovar Daytona]
MSFCIKADTSKIPLPTFLTSSGSVVGWLVSVFTHFWVVRVADAFHIFTARGGKLSVGFFYRVFFRSVSGSRESFLGGVLVISLR